MGVLTGTASEGLNFVVSIKNDRSRKATSHIAVISILVLLRGIFGLAIFYFFSFCNEMLLFVLSTKCCKTYLKFAAKLCVNVKPLSSIPYVIPSIFVVNTLYIIMATAEVPIPRAVL